MHLVMLHLLVKFALFYQINHHRFVTFSDVFKKRFLDSLGQSNSQVLTDDLRNMIMSASNDQEVDAIIQALKKYVFQYRIHHFVL